LYKYVDVMLKYFNLLCNYIAMVNHTALFLSLHNLSVTLYCAVPFSQSTSVHTCAKYSLLNYKQQLTVSNFTVLNTW